MARAMRIGRGSFADGGDAAPPPRRDMLALAFVALLALTLLGPLMQFGSDEMAGQGNPIRQLGYVLLLTAMMVALRPIAAPRRLLAVPWPFVVALGWCLVTIAWSDVPAIALRRLGLTAIIIWSVFLSVRALGYRQVLPILRVVMVVALVANYAAVLGWPDVGIHQYDEAYDKALIGDWRGIMQHKNIAGATAALTVLLFAFDAKAVPRTLRWGVVALAAIFLVKSGSRTSMGLCGAAVLAGVLYMLDVGRARLVLIPGACLAAIAAMTALNVYNTPWRNQATAQETFTGRTEIWDMLLRYARDDHMGTGYGSFWNVGPDSPVYVYGRSWILTLASGHNGFLDLLVTVGVIGLVLIVAATMIWPLGRLLAGRSAVGAPGALLFSCLFFTAAHNCTESSVFDRDTLVGVFLVVFAALIQTSERIDRDVSWKRPESARSFSKSG